MKKCPAVKKCRADHLKRLALASAAAVLASIAGLKPHSASASDGVVNKRQIHMIPPGGRGQLTRHAANDHAAKMLALDPGGTSIYTGRLDEPSLVVLPAKVYVKQRQKASASLDGPISKILVEGKLPPPQQHTLVVADPAQWEAFLGGSTSGSSIHHKIVRPGEYLTLGRRSYYGFEGLLDEAVKPIHVAIHNYLPPEGHSSETTVAIRDIESTSPGIQYTAVKAPIYYEFSHYKKPTLDEMLPRLAAAWTDPNSNLGDQPVWTAGALWPEAPAKTLEESPLTNKHISGYNGDSVLITMAHKGPILRYDPRGIKGTLDDLDNLPGLAQISAEPRRWLTADHKIREGQLLLSMNFGLEPVDIAHLFARFDHVGTVPLPAILGESVTRISRAKDFNGQPLELIALYFDHSHTN